MSDTDWESAYRDFHASYYSFAHMETILRRMTALRVTRRIATVNRLAAYRESVRSEGVSFVESGYIRMRRRKQRRSGLPLENPLVFYPKHWFRSFAALAMMGATNLRLRRIMRRIKADPGRFAYMDAAIAPVDADVTHEDLIVSTRVTDYARKRMAKGQAQSAA